MQGVEMEVAPFRALTLDIFIFNGLNPKSRNGGRPFQGIDTTLISLICRSYIIVEMEVAPFRALTPFS